jgi:very-short-patch-repair endonuclease
MEKVTYPIIKIPYFVSISKTTNPTIGIKRPVKPIEPIEPTKPVEKSDYTYGCVFIIGIVLTIYISYQYEHKITFLVPIGILVGLSFLMAVLGFDPNSDEKELNQYNERKRKYEDYKWREYPKLLKTYEIELSRYENECNEQLSPVNVNLYRTKVFHNYLSSAKTPSRIINPLEIREGVSESYFYNFLNERFPNKIFRYITIVDFSFVPDFIYWDKEKGIIVDIEIDEPYEYTTGEPIHHHQSNDSYRDTSFTNEGWFVIRFAEKQVISETSYCLDFLSNFIKSIEKVEFDNLLSPIFNVTPIEQWTKEEAYALAYRRYRDTYLKDFKLG